MANRFELALETFEITSKTYKLLLSVASAAFIYDVPLRGATHDDLMSLIQSKQLWLLPRGLCRLELVVKMRECGICGEEAAGFLEFIADRVCQSSLWSRLGLTVEILAVQYHSEEANIPNLFFSIKQLDMSSALLSPPHAPTAQFKGLECSLIFESTRNNEAISREEELIDSEYPLSSSPTLSSAAVPTDDYTLHASDLAAEPWEVAAQLIEAALNVVFGLRKRFQDLTVLKQGKAPSLLDLAPAVWNAHYLKSTVSHVKNFAVISNILASSVNGQSPELRRKAAGLLEDSLSGANKDPSLEAGHPARRLELSIQRRLWDLLQATLKPTIGTSRKTTRNPSPAVGLDTQVSEANGTTIDEGSIDQHNISYDHHYLYQTSQPPSELGYYDFLGSAGYHSGIDYMIQGDDDISLSQDHEILEPSELENTVGGFSDGHEFNLDSPNNMQDHPMADYLADSCVYGWEYDGASASG